MHALLPREFVRIDPFWSVVLVQGSLDVTAVELLILGIRVAILFWAEDVEARFAAVEDQVSAWALLPDKWR